MINFELLAAFNEEYLKYHENNAVMINHGAVIKTSIGSAPHKCDISR